MTFKEIREKLAQLPPKQQENVLKLARIRLEKNRILRSALQPKLPQK